VIKARAFPRTTFEGQVMAVAPIVTKQTDWQPERTVLVTTRSTTRPDCSNRK